MSAGLSSALLGFYRLPTTDYRLPTTDYRKPETGNRKPETAAFPDQTTKRPNMEQTDTTPWYRQFWPWFILAILSWGVISATITLSFALRNPPHMMTGDYARLGKALVDTHVRADRAEALGLAGTLVAGNDEWLLRLDTTESTAPQLLLLVQHPADSTRDRQVVLNRSAPGEYRAAAIDIPARGRLIVSDLEQTWWISSSFQADGKGLEAELKPERL